MDIAAYAFKAWRLPVTLQQKWLSKIKKDALSDYVRQLRRRIETLDTRKFLLHPTKCRCLARSYYYLLGFIFTSPSSSLFIQLVVPLQLRENLLHTLQEGERFLRDCTAHDYQGSRLPFSGAAQQKWLMDKALPIALSTDILDVHLHDFVTCICALIWALYEYRGDRQGVMNQAQSIEDRLTSIWDAADEEADVESMQKLFLNELRAKEHAELCELMCRRLSESTSRARLNLTDAVLPPHLLMDPPGFKFDLQKSTGVVRSNTTVVSETTWMGRKFMCKHFARSTSEQEFGHEAVIHASLRHANVVPLVWCTRRPTSQALVMELMDADLGQVLTQKRLAGGNPPFSLLAAVDIMLQIAKGMEYLHDKHIMHRDLKSFNVLVKHFHHGPHVEKTDQMCVKIADFGISKVKYDTSLFTTKKVGTSIWRAPEVMDDEDGRKYTNQADVYSFAIVCSEICTGLPPEKLFPCANEGGPSKLLQLLKEGRRPELPSSCPPAIANYIEKCWHGDALARPTFNEICIVFRFFKACLLLGKMDILQTPLPDDMFDREERRRFAAKRGSQSMFYHPVLGIPSEMYLLFRLVQARNSISKAPPPISACSLLGEMDMLQTPLPDDMFDREERQRRAVERQSQSMFYDHPVLGIQSVMYTIFQLVLARNPITKGIVDKIQTPLPDDMFELDREEWQRIAKDLQMQTFFYDPFPDHLSMLYSMLKVVRARNPISRAPPPNSACLLFGEMDVLQTPLPDDMFNREEQQRIRAEIQSEIMCIHPVLYKIYEMYSILTLVQALNPISRGEMDMLQTSLPADIFDREEWQRIAAEFISEIKRLHPSLDNLSVMYPLFKMVQALLFSKGRRTRLVRGYKTLALNAKPSSLNKWLTDQFNYSLNHDQGLSWNRSLLRDRSLLGLIFFEAFDTILRKKLCPSEIQ